MTVRALYLHVPFCKRKCAYCDFASFATPRTDPLVQAYCQALAQQVETASDLGFFGGLRTAYIGGGTPTHAGEHIIGVAQSVSFALDGGELTVEANPESANLSLMSRLKDAGVTRISMGVQSLQDDELRALGRIHDAKTALCAIEGALDLGFSVSADLMCAIPRQTSWSWHDTLSRIADTGIGHVSVYPLMIEEGTAFSRAVDDGTLDAPDDGDEAARMVEAQEHFAAHGFSRYEVASYAKPGFDCRHNQAYWTGMSYLGLGFGAASMLDAERDRVIVDALPQIGPIPPDAARIRLSCTTDRRFFAAHSALADQSFDVEFLTLRESIAEDLMLGARMSCGPSPELVERARNVMGAELDECLASLIDDGYLTPALEPTNKGWLLGNELYGRLWGLATSHR